MVDISERDQGSIPGVKLPTPSLDGVFIGILATLIIQKFLRSHRSFTTDLRQINCICRFRRRILTRLNGVLLIIA